jgi:hypothetical protein
VCTVVLAPLTTPCATFLAVTAVLFATYLAFLTGPAETVLIETAKARMIEKNVFMVLKDSFLTARARLPGCRGDCAADRCFKFRKRSQLFIRMRNETLSIIAVRGSAFNKVSAGMDADIGLCA